MKDIIILIKLKLIKLLINSVWKYNSNMCKEKFTESTLDDLYTLINKYRFLINLNLYFCISIAEYPSLMVEYI